MTQNWFIRVKDGVPFEYPISGDNMRYLFENFDGVTAPEGFELIQLTLRAERPGVYEVFADTTYERIEGVLQTVNSIRPMTSEEIAEKQNKTRQEVIDRGLFSWVLDEATCTMQPPVPYPEDGKDYVWDEPSLSWIDASPEL